MNTNSITNICLVVIVIATIGFWIYTIYAKKHKLLIEKRRIIDSFPNIISTLGVLGTFLGITIGLVDFNPSPDKIDASISNLLNGLKTAFYTSLAGMTGSLLLRWLVTDRLFDKAEKGISSAELAAATVCQEIKDLSKHIVNAMALNSESTQRLTNDVDAIKSSQVTFFNSIQSQLDKLNTDRLNNLTTNFESLLLLSRNQDSSLIEIKSKLKEIKDGMQSTNQLLSGKFDEFAELLKKSNTEALVEVMKGVTEEFQKQMNDLVSKLVQENFEQLNKSVENLNTWQVENKEMIDRLTKQYKQMSDEFASTSTHLRNIANDTTNLVGDGGKLSQLIAQLNKVMIDDTKFIEIATKLENSATTTEKTIEQFEKSNKTLNEWVQKHKDFVESTNDLIKKLDELNKLRNYSEEFWKETKQGMNDGVAIIQKGSESLISQIKEQDTHFYQRLSETLTELDRCIQAMITKSENK